MSNSLVLRGLTRFIESLAPRDLHHRLMTTTMLALTWLSWRLAWLIGLFAMGSLSWIVFDYVRVLKLRRKMPPGPFPLPLFGNWFDIPKIKPWIEFENMSKRYSSPMITLWNGRRPVIICNDAWTISDLLEKRAALYSSRPHMIVMGDMMNQTETNQVCQVYGDKWRMHRRLTVGRCHGMRMELELTSVAFGGGISSSSKSSTVPEQRIKGPAARPPAKSGGHGYVD
jgi:hypothetical protein